MRMCILQLLEKMFYKCLLVPLGLECSLILLFLFVLMASPSLKMGHCSSLLLYCSLPLPLNQLICFICLITPIMVAYIFSCSFLLVNWLLYHYIVMLSLIFSFWLEVYFVLVATSEIFDFLLHEMSFFIHSLSVYACPYRWSEFLAGSVYLGLKKKKKKISHSISFKWRI